ncbi:isocitrate dehydrogenase [NAD] subunit gamma, mitochondrial-like [Ranitomeya imitator]|uniref:isocitrate dehydrogenase [NAD] subunit gamma, mitochondrial-like n=1 Tax=Ranitomeya imitator TaxID=111125 RepID=UPI0037E7DE87
MIPGDGIGQELSLHVKEIFRHACVPVDFEVVNVNSTTTDEDDIQNAITAIRRNRVALKGNIETNHNMPPSHRSRNNLLRTSLDLYANVIHCQSLPGVQTRHKDIDILIVRENTEGEYSSLEHESVSGVVESLKIITRTNLLRIADYAFKLAREKGRKKITAVHKANIMKLGDGLFLQCCKEVDSTYHNITFQSMIVDNTTMQVNMMAFLDLKLYSRDGFHPQHLKKGIPKGQFYRIKRNCSTQEDFRVHSQDLTHRFKDRGYPKQMAAGAYFNCKSRNLIYALICPCLKIYVGQTTQELRRRIQQHFSNITTAKKDLERGKTLSSVASHFFSVHNSQYKGTRIMGLERVQSDIRGGDITLELLRRESKWIFNLNCQAPSGLNEDLLFTGFYKQS